MHDFDHSIKFPVHSLLNTYIPAYNKRMQSQIRVWINIFPLQFATKINKNL
jgi:ribosomal protein L16/L10AE